MREEEDKIYKSIILIINSLCCPDPDPRPMHKRLSEDSGSCASNASGPSLLTTLRMYGKKSHVVELGQGAPP